MTRQNGLITDCNPKGCCDETTTEQLFPWEEIISSQTVTIGERQEMSIHGDIIIDGLLDILGTFAQED